MKNSELLKIVEAGEIVCVGTFFSGRVDKISFRDSRNGGARREALVSREVILTEKDPIAVTRFLPDGAKAEEWKASATRGDKVMVRVQGMSTDRGAVTLQGEMIVVEDDE